MRGKKKELLIVDFSPCNGFVMAFSSLNKLHYSLLITLMFLS